MQGMRTARVTRALLAGVIMVWAGAASADEQAKRLQTQVEAAIAKVNQSPALLKQIGDMQKQGDTNGVQHLLVDQGAPNSLKIRGVEGTPAAAPSAASVKCKYYDQPVYISCTVALQ